MNLKNNSIRYLGYRVCLFCLLLTVHSCIDNNVSIGKGVFNFEPDSEDVIKIYSVPNASSPSFEVRANFSSGRLRLKLISYLNDSIKFRPLSYGELLGYFSVRVLVFKGDWLEVVVNERTQKTGWIKASKTEVESWEVFLRSVHHINTMDETLHKSPGSKGVLSTKGNYCFNVIDIQEDWLKVHHDADRCNDNTTWATGPNGFLQWKNDGKLLIHFRM